MSNRSHDHNLVAIVKILATVVIVIAVLIASAHPLPGLQDVAAVLPALVDLVTAIKR